MCVGKLCIYASSKQGAWPGPVENISLCGCDDVKLSSLKQAEAAKGDVCERCLELARARETIWELGGLPRYVGHVRG